MELQHRRDAPLSGRSDEPSLEPIESLQRRALRHLEAGLRGDPGDRHCLQLLGRLYLDMGYYQRSLESYQALHRIEPESPFALYGIYQSAKRVGDPVEADEAYRKMADIRLSSPHCQSVAGATLVMYERARLLLEKGHYEQVIRQCLGGTEGCLAKVLGFGWQHPSPTVIRCTGKF